MVDLSSPFHLRGTFGMFSFTAQIWSSFMLSIVNSLTCWIMPKNDGK